MSFVAALKPKDIARNAIVDFARDGTVILPMGTALAFFVAPRKRTSDKHQIFVADGRVYGSPSAGWSVVISPIITDFVAKNSSKIVQVNFEEKQEIAQQLRNVAGHSRRPVYGPLGGQQNPRAARRPV